MLVEEARHSLSATVSVNFNLILILRNILFYAWFGLESGTNHGPLPSLDNWQLDESN